MKLDNYRLNWDVILKKEIDFLSKKYPDIDIRGSYTSIINLLNENKIKSRIILNKNEFIGYAYVMDSSDKSDRLYADIGFISPKKITEARLKELFDWLTGIARESKKKLMLNQIFNGNEISDKYLETLGFKTIIRKRMVLDLNEYSYRKTVENYDISGIEGLNMDLYSDAEYEAFKYTSDKYLFSDKREDRIQTVKNLFNGEYGEIIPEVSFILKNKGRISGGVVSSRLGFDRAFIVSIFVKRAYRKKGIGKYLLFTALNRFKALSFHYVFLWVNAENFARDFYERYGFVYDDYPDEMIYYLPYKK
ncbi:N-acetyltransferase [Ferroplasma sp.]|uniref:GNAT family N-acetyltransferase n=1 Tax=Ferroplasma sp. TaxID=2591003 RepID=UPI00260CEBA3|nr:GNAT family N-acetyltransferase [Ferroplasma sp.]MCL4453690.1 GNAT family N-acetyltransferase [Candidatus Thermoplasmatota archaeon]